MQDTIAIQTYPQILIVYSNNVICYEQHDMFEQIRTFVLVVAQGKGYIAIAKKAPTQGYVTLKRWQVDQNGSVSFHIPIDMTYKLDVRLLPEMVTRYTKRPKAWSGIKTTTRYNGIMAIPHGTTSTCQN